MSELTPQEILKEMMDVFTQNTSGIFTFSNPEFIEREKGIYGTLVAKPSRRLSSSLAVDRELAVIFSNFPDQQARTIQTVRQYVEDSDGRLESTVAIVVHKDQYGNAKLKNWGREKGLSILPVFLVPDMPSGDDFERLLCAELYSHDPFDVTGPVSDDSQFYGRRTEAQDLARKLQTSQIRSCLGIRKIGKTSVLNRVINDTRKYHNCICVMIDCSRDEIWGLNARQLLASITGSVEEVVRTKSSYISVKASNNSFSIAESTRKLVGQVLSCEVPVILFMDEVDYITPSSPTAPDIWKTEFNIFWRNFRAVYQEVLRSSGTLSLLISGVTSKWFTVESIDSIENAALALVPEEYLSPLPRGATIPMIRKLARSAGIQFDEIALNKIAEVCADMPYWVRKACSYIHRHIDIDNRPVSIDVQHVSTLLEGFVGSEGAALSQVALRHLFRVYPELESVAFECYFGNSEKVSKQYLAVLEKYGILANHRGKYEMFGDMMKEGFKLHLDMATLNPDQKEQLLPKSDSKLKIDDLNEWADELAVINKRRNLLEKRLRQIVLNFIRFDNLKQKNVNVSDRLLSVIPENQRNRYVHLTAEEIIEKFTWRELAALIAKEWALFSPIFTDKVKFTHDCEIINDRYDTHAKNVDLADLALYRRSLNYLEEAVSKIG